MVSRLQPELEARHEAQRERTQIGNSKKRRGRGLRCGTLLSTCHRLQRKCVTGETVMNFLETSVCVIAPDGILPGGGLLRDKHRYGQPRGCSIQM
jgi:hypothetical protein